MERKRLKLKAILFSVTISLILFIILVIIVTRKKDTPTVDNEIKQPEQQVVKKEVEEIDYEPKKGIFTPGTEQQLASVNIKEYRAFLQESYYKPANFNGHYRVVSFDCGLGCSSFEIIDKDTGFLYKVPESNDFGNFIGKNVYKPYSLDSNLIHLIVNKGTQKKVYSFDGKDFTVSLVENIKIH